MRIFFLCFVPLFVAVDAIALLPLFINLTLEMKEIQINKIIWQSVMTASVVTILFIFVGKVIFSLLQITVSDFMIAGGLLLFIIAMRDLVSSDIKQLKADDETLGAVPLGVPLIVGPAVLTTSLILVNEYGHIVTLTAALINIVLAGILLIMAKPINNLFGKSGVKTLSKLASLLLSVIAIKMIRKGIILAMMQ